LAGAKGRWCAGEVERHLRGPSEKAGKGGPITQGFRKGGEGEKKGGGLEKRGNEKDMVGG